MTVEERNVSMRREGGGPRDQFPVGMRVLAVDDDPTCLKLLERLLRQCQYQVTTTNQAITALKLLRENKDRFDLVISDVHMPDMDGFKLLELVGLEMDLPVIMLSANGETKAVMKGITHGACDYLLKPVRIEELRNIWQHVVRRKKLDHRDHYNYDNGEDCENTQQFNSESWRGSKMDGPSDCNGKFNRKRKDQNEEDEDDAEEDMHENEDPAAQKKPRVVWSVELHRKFVAAVNQLGIDKAVPKRILDLMNVEKLTRENVASHLQKYRLYLKRLSAVASQQANMVAAFGGRDSTYLPMGSLDGFGDFHALAASGQLPALAPFQPGGVLSRTDLTGLHGFAPSGIVQPGRTLSSPCNPIGDLSKPQHMNLSEHGTLLHGMPTSLEVNQLQQNKKIQELNNRLLGGLSGAGLATSNSKNSFIGVAKSPLLLQAPHQHTESRRVGNHSSLNLTSMCSNPLQANVGVSSHFPDLGRCNDTWHSSVPLAGYTTTNLPMAATFSHDGLTSMGANIPVISQVDSNALNISSSISVAPPDPSIRRTVQCQASSLGGNTIFMPSAIDEDSNLLNFETATCSQQKWKETVQDQFLEPTVIRNSSLNSALTSNHMIDPVAGNQRPSSNQYNKKTDMQMLSPTNISPIFTQYCKMEKSAVDSQLNHMDNYMTQASKLQDGLTSNGCSLDDLVNSVIKPEREDVPLMDGEMGFDFYSLGACM